jgi:hypothetical protein
MVVCLFPPIISCGQGDSSNQAKRKGPYFSYFQRGLIRPPFFLHSLIFAGRRISHKNSNVLLEIWKLYVCSKDFRWSISVVHRSRRDRVFHEKNREIGTKPHCALVLWLVATQLIRTQPIWLWLFVSSEGNFTVDHTILYHCWKRTSMKGSDDWD